jgi:hypothetical protein
MNEQENSTQPQQPTPSGLKTFQHDAAEALRQNSGSLLTISVAEEEKRQKESSRTPIETKEGKRYLLFTIIFILGGLLLAGGYFLFTKQTAPATPVQTTQKIVSLIRTETHTPVIIGELSSELVQAELRKVITTRTNVQNTIDDIYPIIKSGDAYNSISSVTFLERIGSTAPSSLLRTLSQHYLFGVYHDATGSTPFLLLTTDSYQSAFAGMLSWERSLFDDFYQLFAISIEGQNATLFNSAFVDGTIKNLDARILRDGSGNPALIYLFLNNKTLLITTNGAPVNELLARISIAERAR